MKRLLLLFPAFFSLTFVKAQKPTLRAAEFELGYAPIEHQFMVNTNGFGESKRFKFSWLYEYNFSSKVRDYSFSFDPKIYGPLHASVSLENDLFGEMPEQKHLQIGLKSYLQELKWFRKPFLNFNVGVNYSLAGAEHRKGELEVTYNFLTHPLWIKPEKLGLVFQSSGRIRDNHDFLLFQAGLEYPKLHSIFMLGTGQVYNGKFELFLGLQYSFIQDHNKLRFR